MARRVDVRGLGSLPGTVDAESCSGGAAAAALKPDSRPEHFSVGVHWACTVCCSVIAVPRGQGTSAVLTSGRLWVARQARGSDKNIGTSMCGVSSACVYAVLGVAPARGLSL